MFKVLLIDDDKDILDFIQKTLRHLGFTVDGTNNINNALTLFKADQHDLIITDLVLPESSGIDAIRLFKKINPAIKIIAISGGGQISPENFKPESETTLDILKAAKQAGASITMTKPFKTNEFIEELINLIAV